MATYKTPGVFVEEISTLPPSVAEVSTAIPAFIGCTANGPSANKPDFMPVVARISTMLEYETLFGGACPSEFTVKADLTVSRTVPAFDFLLYYSVDLYFRNGGGSCYIVSIGNYESAPSKGQFIAGLKALEKEDEPTILLLTEAINFKNVKEGKTDFSDYYDLCQNVLAHCRKMGDRFAILDVPDDDGVANFRDGISDQGNLMYGAAYYPSLQTALVYDYIESGVKVNGISTTASLDTYKSSNTALYNQVKSLLAQQRVTLPPSSAVAGVYASVDRERGVWKAPANVGLSGVIGPVKKITQEEQENLNIDAEAGKSINAIRAFTGKGTLVWGARTLAGNDNEWRYVSVRRLFIMIEESIQKSTGFAVFEPNDIATWLKVKAMIESYLYGLWQQGALAGATAEAAYFVNLGLGKSMTPQDVLEGRMIVEVGIAAVRPAEFIILRFTHKMQQA